MAKCDRCDKIVDRSDLNELRSWYATDKVKDICDTCEEQLEKFLERQRKRSNKELQAFLDRTEEKRFVPLFTRLRRMW